MTQGASPYAHDPTRWRARGYIFAGGIVIIGLFGGMTYWGTTAQLEGAVIAQGELRVETNSKPVQHREGGIVGEILVKNDDIVTAGQPLLRLDRTTETASLSIVDGQLAELLVRRARLWAVRDEQTRVSFSEDILAETRHDPDIETMIRGQQNLFAARLQGYRQQRAQLAERIAQLLNEIRASQARREGFDTQLLSLDEDIKTQQHLLDRGLSCWQGLHKERISQSGGGRRLHEP